MPGDAFHQYVASRDPICRPFRADHIFDRYLGLKPQAESYYPFGIDPDRPDSSLPHNKLRPVHIFDATPNHEHEATGESKRFPAHFK
jgi:hypothetical protein